MRHEDAAARAGLDTASHWDASLELHFAAREGGTRLARSRHEGPLRVQRPFYPEGPGVPHVYVLHPPGGLASGDRLAIDVQVAPGAHALATTPAAGKCYRSDGRIAEQRQRLRVAAGASLEWLPQENIVFDGARVRLGTRVELEEGARFIGWEILCLGRPASRERFARGHCSTRFELLVGERPLVIERAHYDGGAALLDGRFGLGGNAATGTLFAAPASVAALTLARGVTLGEDEEGLVSATLLDIDGGVLACRYLGPSAARGREHFARVWAAIRPERFGRPAVWPRIWST
jgi:urease accessory protein